jgi:hypothetical protein
MPLEFRIRNLEFGHVLKMLPSLGNCTYFSIMEKLVPTL